MLEKNIAGKLTLGGLSLGTGVIFSWIFGDYDDLLRILITFMVLDMIAGSLIALKQGRFSSRGFGRGIKRKVMSLTLIALSVGIDRLLGKEWTVRAMTMWSLLAYEGISIIEHAIMMELPIPKQVVKALDYMRAETKPMDYDELQELINAVDKNDKIREREYQRAIEELEEYRDNEKKREEQIDDE